MLQANGDVTTTEGLKVIFNNSKHFQAFALVVSPKNLPKEPNTPTKKHPTNLSRLRQILAPVEFAPAIHLIDL